jgi:hypothetical protein
VWRLRISKKICVKIIENPGVVFIVIIQCSGSLIEINIFRQTGDILVSMSMQQTATERPASGSGSHGGNTMTTVKLALYGPHAPALWFLQA